MVSEFEFSTDKIAENFSNYSAFHHRSIFIKLLPSVQHFLNNILKDPTNDNYFKEFENIITQEFTIIENAVFTEPDDQSAWWYHQFLLSWLKTSFEFYSTEAQQSTYCFIQFYVKILISQKNLIQNLLDLENKNKWALVSLVNIYEHILKVPFAMLLVEYDESPDSTSDLLSNIKDTQRRLVLDLIEVDPSHKCRYNYILNKA